jgi:hypothetical protein
VSFIPEPSGFVDKVPYLFWILPDTVASTIGVQARVQACATAVVSESPKAPQAIYATALTSY